MELILDSYKTLKDAGDKYNAYKVRQTKRALKAMHMYIDSLTKIHNSEEVRKKTIALDKRFHEEIGSAIPFSWIVERFLNMRVSKVKNKPQKQVVSDPPPPLDLLQYVRSTRMGEEGQKSNKTGAIWKRIYSGSDKVITGSKKNNK